MNAINITEVQSSGVLSSASIKIERYNTDSVAAIDIISVKDEVIDTGQQGPLHLHCPGLGPESLITNNSLSLDINFHNHENNETDRYTSQMANYGCDICFKWFYREDLCNGHKLWHKGVEKPFTCTECDIYFPEAKYYLKHIQLHTGDISFPCDECGKSFILEKDMKRHRSGVHGERSYHCLLCDHRFSCGKSLKRHMDSHCSEKRFKCDICNMQFKNSEFLQRHKYVHDKPYSCNECEYRCTTKYKLKEHMASKHLPIEQKPFGCNVCDFRTIYEKSLKQHMMRHLDVKPYVCDVCGKRFTTNIEFKNHRNTHTGEKPYECHVCNKRFGKNNHLRTHISGHTKEKRHFCSECPYASFDRWRLRLHLNTVHSTNKPHQCPACGNSYKTKGNLQKHQTGKRGTCKGITNQTG